MTKLEHNIRWFCGSVLAQFLVEGRFPPEVTPDGFIHDMCEAKEYRNMTIDELAGEKRRRQKMKAIQEEYMEELRERYKVS